MKALLVILSVLVSLSVLADEPSVRDECGAGFKSYSLNDKARFDVCPMVGNAIKVDIVSVGSNYHTCWWMVTVSAQNDGVYVASDSDCSVSFTVDDATLEASFSGACRYFCGARAFFPTGTYLLVED